VKKFKNAVPEPVVRPAPIGVGGTDRSLRQLADATHRLTVRRSRDLLPGKIETKRLVLRAPIRGDVPDLVRLADNRNVSARLARMPSPYTRADAVGFIEITAQRSDERPYAITLSENLIGVVGFSYHEGELPELGYWLGEPFWGQGYMSEAARALVDVAHATHQYDRIAARAVPDNLASLRVLEKLGFRRIGKARPRKTVSDALIRLELERPRWM
jgi:RimJ/RimL family protein N-acetyltransferase